MRARTAARLIAELLGLCLAALLAFALALAAERLFTRWTPWYGFVPFCWPLLLCYLAGRIAAIRQLDSRGSFMLPALAAVLALVLIWLQVRPDSAGAWLRLAFLILPAALLGYIGTISVPAYPMRLATASVIIYLAEILVFTVSFGHDEPVSPLTVCALLNFLLALYSANAKGLFDGLHARPGEKAKLPAGIRLKATALLTGSVLVMLLIAATGIMQKVFSLVFRGIGAVVGTVMTWVESLQPEGGGGQAADMSQAVSALPEAEPMDPILGAVMTILLIVFGVLFLSAFLFAVGKTARSRTKKAPKQQRVSEDDQDEIESIFGWADFWKRGREGLGSLLHRKPRFEDMPTDELKIRFAYKTLVYSPTAEALGGPSRTALELSRDLEAPAVSRLAADYSALRYGGEAPAPEAVDNARQALRHIPKAK